MVTIEYQIMSLLLSLHINSFLSLNKLMVSLYSKILIFSSTHKFHLSCILLVEEDFFKTFQPIIGVYPWSFSF